MSSVSILRQFGFDIKEEQESIYPFSPIYKVDNFIIKRTQSPLDEAHSLVNYLNYLNSEGVLIVTPVHLKNGNPLQIGDECYVCYPFIEGQDYHATSKEIRQAGELLGQIHSLSSKDNLYELKEYDVFDFDHDEVDDHIEKIGQFISFYQVDINLDYLKEVLHRAVLKQDKFKNASLTWVETPHDYKANNLIFKDSPVLIDPDNAAWIPRVFDLALALLLFHNEISSAPGRVFTSDEWKLFLEGYNKYQTLTDTEINLWEDTVNHVFMDEVMWLMAEEEEDWERKQQRDLFVSVTSLISNLKNYSIK